MPWASFANCQKKWGWTLITPGTTHYPLTKKGGEFILIRVVPTEGRQKYKRPLGSATHEKGGFPTPSRFDASPLKGLVHVGSR